MNSQQAINLLNGLEQRLDDYCELNEEGKTAFRMAIEALSCSEDPNNSDCISRQAAIDAICKEGTRLERNGTVAMCEIKQWCIDLLERLPSAQPEPQWIPCSERLPEEERKEYWICTDTGYQCECRWTNDVYGLGSIDGIIDGMWGWKIFDIPQYSHVIAWMHLPEPYREEKSHDNLWISCENETGEGSNTYKCSACGEIQMLIDGTPKDNGWKYCPHCGAKMEGADDE